MREDQPLWQELLTGERLRKDDLDIIDTVLIAVAGRAWELERAITPPAQKAAQMTRQQEALRASPLGQSLLLIADSASGSFHLVHEVERAMKRVYRIVFGEGLGDGYVVPARFHTTKLGRLFHRAYARMYQSEDLMTPAEAYRTLGVARQSLYDRLAEGKLTGIYLSGNLRLLRVEIDAWKMQRIQHQRGAAETGKEAGTL